MKKKDIYRGNYDWANSSEFDHQFACWAKNHEGWSKMKRANKRIAKRREKQKLEREMRMDDDDFFFDDDGD